MAPGIVDTFSGFNTGRPCASRPLAQFVTEPNLPLATYSPVTRSTVKKYPFRAAVDTSFLGLPLTVPSIRTGVCAESQSCMSRGEVW